MILAAVPIDVNDPGRKEFGQGETYLVLPAWHELNEIASYVRRGDRPGSLAVSVVDAYIKAGLVDLVPPEGMLRCLRNRMLEQLTMPAGYRRDASLQRACADCWGDWVEGPSTEWYVYEGRIELQDIGVILPNTLRQEWISEWLKEGVPLSRAYEYTGQADIRPDHLVECMDAKMRTGRSMKSAAISCYRAYQEAHATPTIPPSDGNGVPRNGGEAPKDEEEKEKEKELPGWVIPAAVSAVVAYLVGVMRNA